MTIPFVSKMYHVKPHLLFEALEIPEQGNREKSLRQLNEEYYPQAEGIVIEKVKAAVQAAITSRPDQVPVLPETPVIP
jgi:peptide subunit release factor 1 (eRF1)